MTVAPSTNPSRNLWTQALEAAESGALDVAERLVREAIAGADPSDTCRADYCGTLAAILDQLGRHEAAGRYHEEALRISVADSGDAFSSQAQVCRYLLAEHLLLVRRETEALSLVAEALAGGNGVEAPLRTVEARALAAVGRMEEARAVALRALACAGSEEQRENVKAALAGVLE